MAFGHQLLHPAIKTIQRADGSFWPLPGRIQNHPLGEFARRNDL